MKVSMFFKKNLLKSIAAVAALAAQTFWSAAMWLTARRITGIDVSILPRLKAMVAGGQVKA